jgi:hypothetical protein
MNPQTMNPQTMNPQSMNPQSMTPAAVTQQATCKGLAGTVGCQGCQDCAPNQAMAGQVAPSGPMANTRNDQQNPWNKGILAGLFSRNENKRDVEQYGYPQDGGPVGPQWAPGLGYSQTPDPAADSEGNPQQKPKGVGIFSGFFTKATADQPALQSDPTMGQPIKGAGFWDQSAPVMQGGPVNNPMMTNGSAEFLNYPNGVSDSAMSSDGSCSDPVYADGNFGPGMTDCGCGGRGGMGCRCGKGRCGCGRLGCKGGCRARHPYGGELPHTAADSMTGTPNSAPTYAYPYYTTRGPRDFLADGCAPPQIYPYNPQPLCLPTIGR